MKRETNFTLHINIDRAAWRRIPRLKARLNQAARLTFKYLPAKPDDEISATLLLTGDAAIRRLNRDFRGLDKATNVLSFPQFTPRELTRLKRGPEALHLGDIILSYQYIVGEAKNGHKILINHVTHLMIHGLLHLFGYDHETEAKAARMEKRERKIMAELGLPDPYAIPE